MDFGKSDAVGKVGRLHKPWPKSARWAVTLALLVHAVAIWIAVWGATPPFSPLQRRLYDAFGWYYGLIDQGYSYRYYSNPEPTAVVTALVRYRDGREEEVRLPGRSTRPRLLYQRELALAHWLHEDADEARHETGDSGRSLLAQSFARHIGRTHPGAASVTLSVQLNLVPDPRRVLGVPGDEGQAPVPPAAGSNYSAPERIGEFPCDAS